MNPGVTHDQAIKSYSEAYQAFFGLPAPSVRRLESGAYDIRFSDRSKRYTKTEFFAVISMMNAFVSEGV